MLDFLLQYLPHSEEISERYSEPFVGSCAVFFSVLPKKALLADINPDLINLLMGIKHDPYGVWLIYKDFGASKSDYHFVRDEYNPSTLTEKAARILYLNRTCFKGMWRTNLQGCFNVGYGGQERRWVINDENLHEVSESLKNADLVCSDFEKIIDQSKAGDFLFLDPPYKPGEKELINGHYAKKLFKYQDHVRLSQSLKRATKRKVKWLLTVSSNVEITKLYKNCFSTAIVKGTGRFPGVMMINPGEALIANHPISGGYRI